VRVTLALFIAAGGIFIKSSQGDTFVHFLKETRIELRKVVWPTRRNTSRNNEEHKEKTQAERRRNPSRNKEKHKPKQGETHAKIEGSTSGNRGTH
jgi:hypothetical protein